MRFAQLVEQVANRSGNTLFNIIYVMRNLSELFFHFSFWNNLHDALDHLGIPVNDQTLTSALSL